MEVVSMVKGDERFLFRYERGQEDEVCAAISAMAQNHDAGFDWQDASIMHNQVIRNALKTKYHPDFVDEFVKKIRLWP